MPSSIPYDHPALVLGNLVDTKVLGLLNQVASLQHAIDAAQDKMNSFMTMKRSLAMTINELLDMNVDTSTLQKEIKQLDKSISTAATSYMQVRIKNEASIQQLREQITQLEVQEQLESPLDYSKSQIVHKPLFTDSLKMDAQYFSFGSNLENDALASIESYVKSSTSDMGKASGKLAKQASAQVAQQHQTHSLAGTLIITASCTHKNVSIIEPFVLDTDKLVAAWNQYFSTKEAQIDIHKLSPATTTETKTDSSTPSISIISGAAYGSSFVGMVHLLKSESTLPAEKQLDALKEKLQLGGWLENTVGGFGVDAGVLQEVKQMLSTQQVSSHVSLLTMGVVPTISSSQVQLGVNKLIQPSADTLSALANTTNSNDTVDAAAKEAQEGNRMLSMQKAKMQALLQGLEKIDQGANKVMDTNSLMTAFDNYLASIKKDDSFMGVPIQFYLKKLNRAQIVERCLKEQQQELQAQDSDHPTATA